MAGMVKQVVILLAIVGAMVGGGLYWLDQVRMAPATPLVLSPSLVVQGGQVRVSAAGYFPEEPVELRVVDSGASPGGVSLRETPANVQGSLDSASIVLPDDVTSGEHAIEAVGSISGRRSQTVLYVRARAPWLTLGEADRKPRAPISLIVGGFAPGEGVLVYMKPVKINSPAGTSPKPIVARMDLGTVPTDRVGNSRYTQLKIPYREPGDYDLVAQGTTSQLQVRTPLALAPYQPTFDLSPWFGPPGLKIELNARGFAPGEDVQIFFGPTPRVAATVTADKYGNFWGSGNVVVPYGTFPGQTDVRAVGVESGAGATRQFSVAKPKPWLELTIYYGAPSAPVEFSGGGWAAGEQISFHVGSARNPPVAYGQADAYGWLHDAGPIYIPKNAGEEVIFVAVGAQSRSVASATFKVIYPFGLRPAS